MSGDYSILLALFQHAFGAEMCVMHRSVKWIHSYSSATQIYNTAKLSADRRIYRFTADDWWSLNRYCLCFVSYRSNPITAELCIDHQNASGVAFARTAFYRSPTGLVTPCSSRPLEIFERTRGDNWTGIASTSYRIETIKLRLLNSISTIKRRPDVCNGQRSIDRHLDLVLVALHVH